MKKFASHLFDWGAFSFFFLVYLAASHNVENIAAAIEEQTATMEQVNHIAIDLSQNAQTLQEETQKFTL